MKAKIEKPDRTLLLSDLTKGTIVYRIAEAKLRFVREYFVTLDGLKTRIVKTQGGGK